jgi:hypothetical protein
VLVRGYHAKLRIHDAALQLLYLRHVLLTTVDLLVRLAVARLKVVQCVCHVALRLMKILLALDLLVRGHVSLLRGREVLLRRLEAVQQALLYIPLNCEVILLLLVLEAIDELREVL